MTARPVREVAAAVVAGVVGGLGAWVMLLLASYRARADLCVVTGLVVGVGWRLLQSVRPQQEAPPEPPAARAEHGDGFDELAPLEHRLSWGSVDADRFGSRVRPLLAGIAADRLWSRRGIDARTEPEQARRIVGEPLWELMTGPPPTRAPGRAELTRLVEALERI